MKDTIIIGAAAAVMLACVSYWGYLAVQQQVATEQYIAVRDVDTGCVWRVHYDGRTRAVRKINEYLNMAGVQVCGELPE